MLKVHWWRPENGGRNLGDEITTLVLSRLFDVQHSYSARADADLISTGSILQWLWDKSELRLRNRAVAVVGSGMMHPWLKYNEPVPAKIYSVRGHLSRELLGDWVGTKIGLGDPGLLAAALSDVPRRARHRYGLIAHHSFAASPQFADTFSGLGDIVSIDFRTGNVDGVLAQMASCERIISQGLHGLILADALGIPNAWINWGRIHPATKFKFYDYFSSVGRPFDACVNRSDISEHSVENALTEVPRSRLRLIQEQVIDAYIKYFDEHEIAYSQPAY